MKTILLAAGAAAVALSAGPTLAAAKHAAIAGPKQPIPYSQLSAYLKASPKQRMSKDWWSGQTSVAANADTGATANTSSTTSTPSSSLPGDTTSSASTTAPSTAPSLPATPPVDNPPSTAVNPPATATPGAPPATTPPK